MSCTLEKPYVHAVSSWYTQYFSLKQVLSRSTLSASYIPILALFGMLQDSIPYGKAVLVAEVCRPSPSATSSDVAKLAADYVAWGVDAIAVATDLEDTPGGLQDLFAVCRAVKVPVLQWDWFLHPLQVSRLDACHIPSQQVMQIAGSYTSCMASQSMSSCRPCIVRRPSSSL